MATENVNTLLSYVRLRIGDINPASYRYTDAWIISALTLAVKNLGKWWNYKYLVTDAGDVSRNPNSAQFLFDEATYGVIEQKDENIIALMASIILMEGSFENNAWDAVSWRDAEVAYSNLEQFRSRGDNLKRMIDELHSLITPPAKRLVWTRGNPLQGYKDNPFETKKFK